MQVETLRRALLRNAREQYVATATVNETLSTWEWLTERRVRDLGREGGGNKLNWSSCHSDPLLQLPVDFSLPSAPLLDWCTGLSIMVVRMYDRVCVCEANVWNSQASVNILSIHRFQKEAKLPPSLISSNRCHSRYLCGCSALLLSRIPGPTHTHTRMHTRSHTEANRGCHSATALSLVCHMLP